jgi:hypothetical protein
MVFSEWFILMLRIMAVISIVVGIIVIIAALIPKKEYTQIEQEKKIILKPC